MKNLYDEIPGPPSDYTTIHGIKYAFKYYTAKAHEGTIPEWNFRSILDVTTFRRTNNIPNGMDLTQAELESILISSPHDKISVMKTGVALNGAFRDDPEWTCTGVIFEGARRTTVGRLLSNTGDERFDAWRVRVYEPSLTLKIAQGYNLEKHGSSDFFLRWTPSQQALALLAFNRDNSETEKEIAKKLGQSEKIVRQRIETAVLLEEYQAFTGDYSANKWDALYKAVSYTQLKSVVMSSPVKVREYFELVRDGKLGDMSRNMTGLVNVLKQENGATLLRNVGLTAAIEQTCSTEEAKLKSTIQAGNKFLAFFDGSVDLSKFKRSTQQWKQLQRIINVVASKVAVVNGDNKAQEASN